MPARSKEFYDDLRQLIDEGQNEVVIQKILNLKNKTERVYAVSRLYKELYPHFDEARHLNTKPTLDGIIGTVLANAFLFDLSLSMIEQTNLDLDIRSDVQHAQTLKRMIVGAIGDAIEVGYQDTDAVLIALEKAHSIIDGIIQILRAVLDSE